MSNTSGSLGEREMLWEHEPKARVSTAFSRSPKLSWNSSSQCWNRFDYQPLFGKGTCAPSPELAVLLWEGRPDSRAVEIKPNIERCLSRLVWRNFLIVGMGTGINVTGKLEAGKLHIGDKVVVMPAGKQGLVKGKCTMCYSCLLHIKSLSWSSCNVTLYNTYKWC